MAKFIGGRGAFKRMVIKEEKRNYTVPFIDADMHIGPPTSEPLEVVTALAVVVIYKLEFLPHGFSERIVSQCRGMLLR